MQPQTDDMVELRHQLQLLRAHVAKLKKPELNDLDALLSVAEAEVQRLLPEKPRELSE